MERCALFFLDFFIFSVRGVQKVSLREQRSAFFGARGWLPDGMARYLARS